MNSEKILYVVNVDWFFISHRLPIALEAKKRGYEVSIATTNTGRFKELEDLGFQLYDLNIDRSGTNPLKELFLIVKLISILRSIRPTVVHNVTLKMSIYSSIACRFVKTPKVINAISGLGYNFTANRKTKSQKVITLLMNIAFRKRNLSFIFQNPDDLNLFNELGYKQNNKLVLIKGAGVDLNKFQYQKKETKEHLTFILTARILRDKGISEYILASKIVSKKYPNAHFLLVGDIDKENPASYTKSKLLGELKQSNIQWLGHRNDISELLQSSDIMVFPSYREGLPKSLIEACAAGLPIITTNTIGCRECVDEGINGFLVPIKNSEQLAERMITFIQNPDLIKSMGDASRIKAEKEFSLTMVIEKTFELYE